VEDVVKGGKGFSGGGEGDMDMGWVEGGREFHTKLSIGE
jgi:hypothetical protein